MFRKYIFQHQSYHRICLCNDIMSDNWVVSDSFRIAVNSLAHLSVIVSTFTSIKCTVCVVACTA